MSKYYSESIEKDTKYREEYLQGINEFLRSQKTVAKKQRAKFISPKRYKQNPEFYRRKLIRLLGYPLTLEKEMPVVEKTFVAKDKNVNIYRMQFCFFGFLKILRYLF